MNHCPDHCQAEHGCPDKPDALLQPTVNVMFHALLTTTIPQVLSTINSDNFQLGNGDDEMPSSAEIIPMLLQDVMFEVPGEHHGVIRQFPQ